MFYAHLITCIIEEIMTDIDLHNVMAVPQDRICVELGRGVEPKVHPLLSIPLSICVYICLNCVWLPWPVPQELKVQFISNLILIWHQLQQSTKPHKCFYQSAIKELTYTLNVNQIRVTYPKKNKKKAHVECGDCPSWIPWNELDFHAYMAKHEFVLRSKPATLEN